jgi:hypothetical protein
MSRKKRTSRGTISGRWIREEKRLAIFLRDKECCFYCQGTEQLTLDHVLSRTERGTHEHTNLITACLSCNSSRQDQSFQEFIVRLGLDVRRTNERLRRSLSKDLRPYVVKAQIRLAVDAVRREMASEVDREIARRIAAGLLIDPNADIPF